MTPRLLGKLVTLSEGNQGLAHTKAFQDTMISWLPKMLVARSAAERNEANFMELIESGVLYYGLSGAAQHLLQPVFHALSPHKFSKGLISTPLATLIEKHPKQLAQVLPVKAAIILSTLGASAVLGENAMMYVKNLMTEKLYRKSKFSDIVNLSQGPVLAQNEQSDVARKAKQRILLCLGIAGATLGASAVLSRFGAARPQLLGPLKKFLGHFDFTYEKGQFALSRPLLYCFMASTFIGYLDSARDTLERIEAGTRVGLIIAFLAKGSEVIQKGLAATFGKRFPQLFSADHKLKELEVLAAEALQAAKGNPKAAMKNFMPLLKAKNALFAIPLGISILLPGFGLGLLSRFGPLTDINMK